MVEIREAAVDEGADEIERHRTPRVALDEEPRIGSALRRGESRAVHVVAAIARERDAVARLRIARARLGVLTREATHANDRPASPVHEHEAHLEEDLELGRDRRRVAVIELLAAVAAVEQESPTARRIGELRLQRLDLPARNERRQRAKFVERPIERRAVGPRRLLTARATAPRTGRPGAGCARRAVCGAGDAGARASDRRADGRRRPGMRRGGVTGGVGA